MRPVFTVAVLLSLALPLSAEPQRLVTAGSDVTEIACALGLGPNLIAVDSSSRHLAETRDKPDIGYVRTLGAEGILSQNPDLVILSGKAGPPPVLAQLQGSGVDLLLLDGDDSLEGIGEKIRVIALATNRTAEGDALIQQVEAGVEALRVVVANSQDRPSVIYLMARHGGNLMAAGRATAAHAMIEAIGGDNACSSFDGYKPLSAEFFASSAPDFVIISQSVGAEDADLMARVPGLGATPAGQNLRVIRVDDSAFLGFGPGAPASAARVATALQQP